MLSERLTKIYTRIIPEEPNTNKVHNKICHCRNNQVMPVNGQQLATRQKSCR